MDNYEFVAQWVESRRPHGPILDYGCGAGQIVGLLRARGISAFGCDVFYGGGDCSSRLPEAVRPFIKRIENGVIPFPDKTFSFVVSNQVFEHVPDMEAALREIARVLTPGGLALNLFPDRSVWREGHCGIPFLHRFPKHSSARVYYAAAFRALGFGYHKGTKSIMQWSREFCAWLDDWTYYRSYATILESFSRIIGSTHRAEDEWFRARLGRGAAVLPRPLQRFVTRKLAGLELVSAKPL